MLLLTATQQACVIDELHRTPHPVAGAVVVRTNVAELSGNYTVYIDDTPFTADRNPYTPSATFTPGTHTVLVHNTPQGMYARGKTIVVNTLDDGSIDPYPGHMFAGTQTFDVLPDDTVNLNVDVRQRTRDLHIVLDIAEGDPKRIAQVSATLTGVAGSYDLTAMQPAGQPVNTHPLFVLQGNQLVADLRLLGMIGHDQHLLLTITFTDGRTLTVDTSVAELLAGFNNEQTPLTIRAKLLTPTQSGINTSIIDWTLENHDVQVH